MRDRSKHPPVFFLTPSPEAQTFWRPSADVYRTRTGWLLKFDLAGVSPDDVNVDVCGGRITVSGMRRDWTVEEVCSYHSMEISYNRFERTVELPCDLDAARLALEFRDGILLIRVACPSGRR